MKWFAAVVALALFGGLQVQAQSLGAFQNFCTTGGQKVLTQGVNSSTIVQTSYPRCTVQVYLTGTQTTATLYRDANATPLGNPFTANADASILFFADKSQAYDIVLTGGTPQAFPQPFVFTDVSLGGGGSANIDATTTFLKGTAQGGKGVAALPADLTTFLASLNNCNRSGYPYSPADGACIAAGGAVTGTNLHVQMVSTAGGSPALADTSITLSTDGQTVTLPAQAIGQMAAWNHDFSSPSTQSGSEGDTHIALNLNAYGGGRNQGPVGSGGWRTTHGLFYTHNFNVRGIKHSQSWQVSSEGAGDFMRSYSYTYYNAGCGMAADDEGCGEETSQFIDAPPFQGVVATGGVGNRTPTLTMTGGSPNTTDESYLLDISAGTLAGNFATPPSTNPSGFPAIGVSGVTLPVTTAWAVTTSDIPDTNYTADHQVAATVTVIPMALAGSTPHLQVGYAVLAGPNFTEQVPITAVSADGLTVSFTHHSPHATGARFFQGGIAGQFISSDQNLALSSLNPINGARRSAYEALGSLTGTDLIYQIPAFSGIYAMDMGRGANALTATGGFHLYPGAEIVANLTEGYVPLLEPNPWAWTAGDVVEDPHPSANIVEGRWHIFHLNSYMLKGAGSDLHYLFYDGVGVSTALRPFHQANGNPCTMYVVCGGPMRPPDAAQIIEGVHSNIWQISNAPNGLGSALTNVTGPTDLTHTLSATFNLYNLYCTDGTTLFQGCTQVGYDPRSHAITFTGPLDAASDTLYADGSLVRLGSATAPQAQSLAIYGTPTFYGLNGTFPLAGFQSQDVELINNNHSANAASWGHYAHWEAGVDFSIDGISENFTIGNKLANSAASTSLYTWLRITNNTYDSTQAGVMIFPTNNAGVLSGADSQTLCVGTNVCLHAGAGATSSTFGGYAGTATGDAAMVIRGTGAHHVLELVADNGTMRNTFTFSANVGGTPTSLFEIGAGLETSQVKSFYLYDYAQGYVPFYTSGTGKYVGVNNTTPAYTLDVGGDVHTKAGSGFVEPDTTNGHVYRIVITNGALTLVQIS